MTEYRFTHQDDTDKTTLTSVDGGPFALPVGLRWVNLNLAGGGGYRIATFDSNLVEVVPPLPPEPDLRGVVLDGNGAAWQRLGATWGCALTGGTAYWAEVCSYGEPTLLVLDPFAEKVGLPWRSTWTGIDVRVEAGKQEVVLTVGDSRIPLTAFAFGPAEASDLVRALRAAADAAEAQR